MSLYRDMSDQKTREFTEQYNNFCPLLFSIIYTRVDNFQEAEDICHEVFLTYYIKYDEIKDARKWLLGTLRYTVIGYYKKKKRDINTESIESIFDDIKISYVNGFREARLIIKDALNNVIGPEDDIEKTLFELIAVYRFSYSQVSRQLNLTYKQVRTRFKKIVNRLVEDLKEKGINRMEDLL